VDRKSLKKYFWTARVTDYTSGGHAEPFLKIKSTCLFNQFRKTYRSQHFSNGNLMTVMKENFKKAFETTFLGFVEKNFQEF
jgi:hypothetical protein